MLCKAFWPTFAVVTAFVFGTPFAHASTKELTCIGNLINDLKGPQLVRIPNLKEWNTGQGPAWPDHNCDAMIINRIWRNSEVSRDAL